MDKFYYYECNKCEFEFESNQEEQLCINCKDGSCLILTAVL